MPGWLNLYNLGLLFKRSKVRLLIQLFCDLLSASSLDSALRFQVCQFLTEMDYGLKNRQSVKNPQIWLTSYHIHNL